MKKSISIFFLALYFTTVFSAFLPYIEYLVNYDYISTVLCVNKEKKEIDCNGKCHLEKQIENIVTAQIPINKGAESPIVLTLNDFYPAIIHKNNIDISSPTKEFSSMNKYKNKLFSKDIYISIFHPPQFS